MANSNFSQCRSQIGWLIKLFTGLYCGVSSLGWSSGDISPVMAQPNTDSSIPEICQVNLSLLKSKSKETRRQIITADTVSSTQMTLPSLWWTSEEFPAKLVTNWIADRDQKQIYLLVNSQYWNILDYIDRYQLVDRFGRVAQSYGYNLQLCGSQKTVLAHYTCGAGDSKRSCQLSLNATGQTGLGVQTK